MVQVIYNTELTNEHFNKPNKYDSLYYAMVTNHLF